jgi:hypothetical protein
MHECPTAHPGWRFSIRELLLLTAAVAAFLAWAGLLFQRSRPFARTTIPDKVCSHEVMRTICKSIGHDPNSHSTGGGGSSNTHAVNRSYDCQIDLPAELRDRFMVAYQQHVRAVLDADADRVAGAGTSRDGNGLRGFSFEYEKGATHGTVIVRCAPGENELSLFVFVHEYDTRR